MTRLAAMVLSGKIQAPEVLVGGTPCQAFSVAGMREGLADPRGALTIKYVELLDAIDHVRTMHGQPEAVCLWKTSRSSPTKATRLAASSAPWWANPKNSNRQGQMEGRWLCVWTHANSRMAGSGCPIFRPGPTTPPCVRCRKCSSRVRSPRSTFEREGVRRDTPPRRGEGQDLAGRAPFGPALQCGCGYIFGLDLGQYGCPNCEGDEGPAVEVLAGVPAYGGHGLHGDVSQAATLTAKDTRLDIESETFCIHGTQDPDLLLGVAHTLGRNNGAENALFEGQGIRRLTPKEFERLQGFSDTYTRIPYRGKPADECPDGPRYKAIGNSKAVFVVRWIGRRIQQQLERLD